MLEPKDISIQTMSGDTKMYRLSKFPAVAGREIIAKYPLSSLPRVGDYDTNKAVMLKLMSYVFVQIGDNYQSLSTEQLIDNHVPDYETLVKIEFEMLSYNTSFFQKGKVSTFLNVFKAQLQEWTSSTLTDSLEKLLQAVKQNTKN